MMKSFVSEKDVSILKSHGVNYNEDIIVFINEMKCYFYNTWDVNYHIDINNCGNTIEEFNTLIGNYPSNEGYEIISNSFECVGDEYLDILSINTIELLEYFYNIHLN